MRKTASFFIFLAFLFMMVSPAMAADDTSGIVQLSDPSKIFNDDGTVTVTYDLPLSPYSLIYGQPINSTEFVQVGTSTNIYFTQDKDEYLTVFTSLYDFDAVASRFNLNSSINSYTSATKTGSGNFPFDISHCTHLLIDGVAYPMIFSQYSWQTVDYLGILTTTGSYKNLLPGQYGVYSQNSEDGTNVLYSYNAVAGEPFDGFVQVGYYEDVMISQHEYDKLYPLLYPFGRTNYIDVSNIRSGGSFEVSVTYDYNIVLHGTDTSTDLIQYIDFYDKNFRLISTTSSVTTPFDVANGASSTINTMVTVPEGACYMDMELTTDPFAVSDVQLLDWRVSDMEMALDMSDVEANSLMMSGIIDRLDTLIQEAKEQNASLDEIIQLFQDVIDNMGSAGSDQTEVKDLLEQLLEQQEQNGEQLTPTPEQSDKAEDLENDILDEAASIENNNSMLEQLTPSRPVINTDLTLDPVFLASASPLIANIWSISGMGRIIGVVLAVATVAYIFFGKRDG